MIDRSLNYGRSVIREFLRRVVENPVVVDIGAGSGTDLRIAGEMCAGAKLHAIECYPPNVAALSAQGIAVHARDIERETLPFREESVDVVIANQVLEHTKEIFWIFHEVSRVLKVGGSFVIGVPNLASLHNRLLLLAGRQPTQIKSNSAHVRGFTVPDLKLFTQSCFPNGYQAVQFAGSNFYPLPGWAARPLARAFPSLAWAVFLRFEKRVPYGRQFLDFPRVNRLETNFFLGED